MNENECSEKWNKEKATTGDKTGITGINNRNLGSTWFTAERGGEKCERTKRSYINNHEIWKASQRTT